MTPLTNGGPGRTGRAFPKEARLLKRREYLHMSDRRDRPDLKIQAGSFLIVGRINDLERTRLGVTVTKKVGCAVVRNRLKRLVREFFRLNSANWAPGLDLLFIARPEAAARSKADLAADLARAAGKIAAWKPARTILARPENGSPPGPRDFGPGPDRALILEFYDRLPAIPGQLALGLIRIYQRLISPMLPPSCRFRPTCSCYAVEAIKVHGFVKGSWLTARRLLKCHPFHPGGYDPVPPTGPSR